MSLRCYLFGDPADAGQNRNKNKTQTLQVSKKIDEFRPHDSMWSLPRSLRRRSLALDEGATRLPGLVEFARQDGGIVFDINLGTLLNAVRY